MTNLPTMYVITIDGDKSDADYTGVSKRITLTGAEYKIVGPLAEALRRAETEWSKLPQKQITPPENKP